MFGKSPSLNLKVNEETQDNLLLPILEELEKTKM